LSRIRNILVIAIVFLSISQPLARSSVPALQELANKLDKKLQIILQREKLEDQIIALVVEGDASILGREDRLTQELESLLLYRMNASLVVAKVVPLGSQGGKQAADLARKSGAFLLMRCVLGIDDQTIHLTADLTPLRMPFWDRLANPIPRGAKEHFFVSTKIDDEIHILLGKSRAPPPLGRWQLAELFYLPRRVLDLGMGNLDGVEGAELVLLFEDAIEVYSLRGGNPRRLVTHSLSYLPETNVRVRDPSGSLLVVDFNLDGQAEIFYKLHDRGVGEILSWTGNSLRSIRKLKQVPLCVFRHRKRVQIVYGTPEPGTNHYLAQIEVADINQSSGELFTLQDQFYTLRCFQSSDDQSVWIVNVDLQGKLSRLDSEFKGEQVQEKVGAGAGVVDLDRDNLPELIISDPVWLGEQDSVRVVSKGVVVWQSRDIIGGIVAIAGGDLDGKGKVQAVLAAVDSNETASRIYLLGR